MLKKSKIQETESLKKNRKHEKSTDMKKVLEVKTHIKAGHMRGFRHVP